MRIAKTFLILLFPALVAGAQKPGSAGKRNNPVAILPGASRMSDYLPLLEGRSIVVFANQTSMVGGTHLVDTLLRKGIRIIRIFAPEHGFRGEADAGESLGNSSDPQTGIPVISLYGNKLKPSKADLENIDIMVFDIQDVGTRFYTYISSLQKYLEAAIENNKPLLILDRPNPNGFYVDGPVLDTAFRSFVGMQPVPVVYGMTIAEYAWMLTAGQLSSKREGDLPVRIIGSQNGRPVKIIPGKFGLYIVPNKNYTHKSRYALPLRPSPNLPNMQAVYLYPSLCFFEGTQVSLGRGTDKPFQQFGHPAFPDHLYSFTPRSMPGARNPPLLNQTCHGFDLSSLNLEEQMPAKLQIKWLIQAYSLYPDKKNFFLNSGFFNKLAGNATLMQQIKDGKSEQEIRSSWQPGISRFKKLRKKYLIYPDFE